MGSMGNTEVIGEFTHPVIYNDTVNSDPWQRGYHMPPPMEYIPKSFRLTDIRPYLLDPGYKPIDLLKSHGFGVVKHSSPFLEQTRVQEEMTTEKLVELYHPEITELVKQTTGAKHVFILTTVLRTGPKAPEPFKIPNSMNARPVQNGSAQTVAEDSGGKIPRLGGAPTVAMQRPLRVPHMDYTPLGARNTIRFSEPGMYNTAVQCGVTAAEDEICQNQPFKAHSEESNSIIAEQYNKDGKLGPRYAAYSIWRPLKTVERDPLALCPPAHATYSDGNFVHWPYPNRIPGHLELGGDYLREFAFLGVKDGAPESSNALKWYYVSSQEPDEVLFIKLFDSAALGEGGHAGAPYHASPEIGSVAGEQPRESLEIRVLVFW